MEAGGVASDKRDAQHASKDGDFHIKEQCELEEEVSFRNTLKHGIWGLNEGGMRQDITQIGVSKGVSYKRGPWTKAEDAILRKMVEEHGPNDWVKIELQCGLDRTSKSCRLRWKNHLQPNLKKGSFSFKEETDVIRMHYRYGNKWSLMAKRLPGRSDNEIKNLWHSRTKKCKKRGLPLYPDWCLKEEQTSDDDELCGRSNGETMRVSNSLSKDQETRRCSYYPRDASTNETVMIETSKSTKSPGSKVCFSEGNAQPAVHGVSSFNQSTDASHISPMDFSPPELFPSFQYFLSPRPKPLLSSSSSFSTSFSSTPYQLPYNQVRNFNNESTFETLLCPPLLSSPSSRFKRIHGATLPPSVKPTEVPYSNFAVSETPMSHLKLNMSSPNEAISDNNTHLLDTLLQDAQVDSCLSDIRFVEQYLFSHQSSTPHHLYEKILRRKEYNSIRKGSSGRNISNKEVSSNGGLLKSIEEKVNM